MFTGGLRTFSFWASVVFVFLTSNFWRPVVFVFLTNFCWNRLFVFLVFFGGPGTVPIAIIAKMCVKIEPCRIASQQWIRNDKSSLLRPYHAFVGVMMSFHNEGPGCFHFSISFWQAQWADTVPTSLEKTTNKKARLSVFWPSNLEN